MEEIDGKMNWNKLMMMMMEKLTVSRLQLREKLELDQIILCNFPSTFTPVALNFNGNLLRRGTIYFNRKDQCLEISDLQIPLDTSDFELAFVRDLKAASSVECPVSYLNRNDAGQIEQAACLAPCVWENNFCSLPSLEEYGYTVNGPQEQTEFGFRVPLAKLGSSIYGQSVQNVAVEIFQYTDQLLRVKIYDPNVDRYEVPIPLNLLSVPLSDPLYEVSVPTQVGDAFSVQITRRSTGSVLFDTSLAGITFEDKLLTLASRLPSRNLYGLGENQHSTFRRLFDDTTWPIFSRDEQPNTSKVANLYGVHPHYVVIEGDGSAHGVLLYNSNAMEYQLQSAAPAINWRTIGGVLDFYIMLGPHPEDVTKQYLSLVGSPFLPPYWGLGFQLSRWGYNDLDTLKAAINRTLSCDFPLDVFYGDIDTMDQNADFTYDPVNFAGFPEYINELKALGIRYVPIVDPAIPDRQGYGPYARGKTADAFIKLANGSTLMGNVWPPEPVSFPDFFKPETQLWWADEIVRYYETIKFDGLWIDMNEPANFETNQPNFLNCEANEWDDPPYLPKAAWINPGKRMSDKTVCMTATQSGYRQYDVHSLYGWSETSPTLNAMQQATGKRGLVFTRSSFVGSGALGGHWTGDNIAAWDHLQSSIIGLLDFNMFGIPYVGSDICGFSLDTEEELCERWQLLGAYYPFSRNHNSIGAIPQDPCIWPDTVGASGRKAMQTRYNLVPYLYTLFYRVNTGIDGTVVRSLAWEFPADPYTWDINQQFLWGSSFMVSPATSPGQLKTVVYFPQGIWYDWHLGNVEVDLSVAGTFKELDTPHDYIPLHVRGESIICTQEIASTLTESRNYPFGLTIAIDADGTAAGDLFWDDGESINTVNLGQYHYSTFSYQEVAIKYDALTQTIVNDYQALTGPLVINTLTILGNKGRVPISIAGDINPAYSIDYIQENDKIVISDAAIPLNSNFSLTFIYL
ncbi:maltase-glucoamylase-like [Cloeon dipterum]|uniref:maltase-glucoamylase-like n=1 Tax=Cloeon dipterum TaxID=197152 RepID=UPI00321F89CC